MQMVGRFTTARRQYVTSSCATCVVEITISVNENRRRWLALYVMSNNNVITWLPVYSSSSAGWRARGADNGRGNDGDFRRLAVRLVNQDSASWTNKASIRRRRGWYVANISTRRRRTDCLLRSAAPPAPRAPPCVLRRSQSITAAMSMPYASSARKTYIKSTEVNSFY